MRRAIVILSPLLPPMRGGLADHTRKLAYALAVDRLVTVVSSRDVYGYEEFSVRSVIHDWEDVAEIAQELVHASPDAVFCWQYVPHMYGRGGVNRKLVRLWKSLYKAKRKQVFIMHEIYAPWGGNPLHWWYSWNQRRQWRSIRKYADLIGISIESWTLRWKGKHKRRQQKYFLLPSPSNIDVVPVEADHVSDWREANGFPQDIPIMVWFGTVAATKQLTWVMAAWERANRDIGPCGLCILGGTPGLPIPSTVRHLYRSLGYLPSPDISRALQAVDLMLLPFIDGASERRASLMSSLAHGLPVVSTVGHNSGPTMRNADFMVTAPADDLEAYVQAVLDLVQDPDKLQEIGSRGREHYQAHYSWEVTVQTFEAELERNQLL